MDSSELHFILLISYCPILIFQMKLSLLIAFIRWYQRFFSSPSQCEVDPIRCLVMFPDRNLRHRWGNYVRLSQNSRLWSELGGFQKETPAGNQSQVPPVLGRQTWRNEPTHLFRPSTEQSSSEKEWESPNDHRGRTDLIAGKYHRPEKFSDHRRGRFRG